MSRSTTLHEGWEFVRDGWLEPPGTYGYSELEWLKARVPGHVHRDLFESGVIAHPFEAMHELGLSWVDEADFTYRTRFAFEPDLDLPEVVLRFDGLDTVCSVYLNGEKLADHDNMFVPLEIDIGKRVKPGENELRVCFASALRVGRERRARYLNDEGLQSSILRFDERAFVRKAQYMFGWDWGPRLISVGIWGNVSLIQYRGRIEDVHVEQTHLPDGSVELGFRSKHAGEGKVVHFVEGFSAGFRDGDVLRIERPELWYPAGHGAQRLYRVTSLLVPNKHDGREALEATAFDRRESRVGLRRARLVRKPDAFGESFEFEINERRIWAVGANWIPDASFPSEMTRERLWQQVTRARDLNMNMLRIWGGGLYEHDDFYDACDELGVLVWQDFAYACSYYPEDPASLAAAREEASVAVRRLRQHPSLVFWCGNNENTTMFESKWGDATKHPPRLYGQKIYEEVLPEVLAELDPDRPYLPTSPWGGTLSNDGGVGDQHYWDVWHGRGDWQHYRDSQARFASEFGFAAAPGPKALKQILRGERPANQTSVRDAFVRFHDKTLKGFETFLAYVALHYPEPRNLEEWAYYSQLNQRDALRFGIEHYRRSEFCKGSLIWQLNDCWPALSWAVIDSEGSYKAAAYELRRLYAPELVSLERSESGVRVWVVLDNANSTHSGELLIEARNLHDTSLLHSQRVEVELQPGERRVAAELDVSRWVPETTIVTASFLGSATSQLLCEPKCAKLSQPKLSARVQSRELIIESDVPVVDLYLWDEGGVAEFLDNFVTLASGGSASIRFRRTPVLLRARSLAGLHEVSLGPEPAGS